MAFLTDFRKLFFCNTSRDEKKEKWFLFFSNEKKAFLELLLNEFARWEEEEKASMQRDSLFYLLKNSI